MPAKIADQLLDALEANDMTSLRALCSDDFVVWHSFDLVDRPLEQVVSDLQVLHSVIDDIRYGQREFFDIPDGAIGTYVNTGVAVTGTPLALYVALRIFLQDGRITRVNEYVESTQCAPILEAAALSQSQPAD